MNDNLQQLRDQIINSMAGLSGDLSNGQADVSMDTLLLVAHNTGRAELLRTAYEKVEAMTDPAEKADAYLDVLDEVNFLMRRQTQDDTEAEPADAAKPDHSAASDKPAE